MFKQISPFLFSLLFLSSLHGSFLKEGLRTFSLEDLISIDQQAHEWAENNLENLSPEELQVLANFMYFSYVGALMNFQVHRLNDMLLLQVNRFRNEIYHNVYNQQSFFILSKTVTTINQITPYYLHVFQLWQTLDAHVARYAQQEEHLHLTQTIQTLQVLGTQVEKASVKNDLHEVETAVEEITQKYEHCLSEVQTFLNELNAEKQEIDSDPLAVIDHVTNTTNKGAQHGWQLINASLLMGAYQRNLIASGHYFYKAVYQALYEWMSDHDMQSSLTFIISPEGIVPPEQQTEALPDPQDEKGMLTHSLLS